MSLRTLTFLYFTSQNQYRRPGRANNVLNVDALRNKVSPLNFRSWTSFMYIRSFTINSRVYRVHMVAQLSRP
jgi:hypothetical protein